MEISAELDEWEQQDYVLRVLTSKEFGAWLARRDSNKKGSFISSMMVTCKDCKYSECCAIKDLQGGDDNFFCSEGGKP